MNQKHGLFATIPHSGRKIPPEADWLKPLPREVLLCDVDLFVDELYSPALKKLKIPFIVFPWHRYAIDANRNPEDKTSLTVRGATKNPLKDISTEIHWRETTKGDQLIKSPIPFSVHQILMEKYFYPFHKKIKDQREQWKRGNYSVYHIDLHSMPSMGAFIHRDSEEKRPQVVISDRDRTSAGKNFTDTIIEAFKTQGFQVSLNWPYKGGRITQKYGNPKERCHTVQIELNRNLYMNEKTFEKTKEFATLKEKLTIILTSLQNKLETEEL